ncbi:hypothetical protein RRG08_047236 [Elysia crispata]|uniref:Uncharacterized protein n=1 Tax=Elysia crispata TaxID=231223 RepID=A0AAE1A3Y8_9GAST|nr:hypothetical protein RRG08_047236 [Elysia crispata]
MPTSKFNQIRAPGGLLSLIFWHWELTFRGVKGQPLGHALPFQSGIPVTTGVTPGRSRDSCRLAVRGSRIDPD